MSHLDGIFGTPPEPLFNNMIASLKDDILEDVLAVHIEENREIIKKAARKKGTFKNTTNMEFLFLMCELVGISEHAKYLAAELYDRFMISHIAQLYDHVNQKNNSKEEWQKVEERVRSQCYLRMLTCLQLASKMTSHYQIISVKRCWSVLNRFGQHYTTKSINASELRILKVIDFNVLLTHPLVYVETLLEIVGRKLPNINIKSLHCVSIRLLDLSYLQRRSMYDMLYSLTSGKPKPKQKDTSAEFFAVEQDQLLLAVAIIAASAYIVNQTTTNKVTDVLHAKTKIPGEDILDFATVLVQMALTDTDL